MTLSPSEIRKTLRAAEGLNKSRQSTQAFILAWTAWDAYNYRVALAAVQMQGLTQASAKSILAKLHAHQANNMKRIRNRLFLDKPSDEDSFATIWRRLESDRRNRTFRERRHGLVHGHGSADPRLLRQGVELIVAALEPTEILEALRVRVKFGDAAGNFEPIGQVLTTHRPHVGSRRGTGTTGAVLEWLG